MNIQKSTAHLKENKKRFVFFIKLFLFVIMIFGFEIIPQIKETLIENPGLHSIYRAVIFLLGTNILISLGRIITARFYLRKSREEKFHGNFLLGITWISNILNVLVFIIAFMLAFNIRPLEFLTSLTIVAAAIAILTKDYVTNMINGLIIMFTDQFSLGDTIKVGEQKGTIEDINLLNLVLKNEDGDKVIIPNTLILTSQVINHQSGALQKLTFDFELPHFPPDHINEIEQQILNDIQASGTSFYPENFSLNIIAIQKDLIKLQVTMMIEKPNFKNIEKILKHAIVKNTNEII